MDNTEKIKLLRKRNAQMQEKLDEIKKKSESLNRPDDDKQTFDLIKELENIREDWLKALEELNKEREEYAKLISELRQLRDTFKSI